MVVLKDKISVLGPGLEPRVLCHGFGLEGGPGRKAVKRLWWCGSKRGSATRLLYVLLMTRSARDARDPAGVVALTQYSSASSPNTSLITSTYVSPSFDIENLSLSASSLEPLYLHQAPHHRVTVCYVKDSTHPRGIETPKLPKLDLTIDAAYVANLLNVSLPSVL